MKLTMPKAVNVTTTTEQKGEWISFVSDPPRNPATVYLVKQRKHGEPFHAWLDWSWHWWKIEPDANADGTRELGAKLRETLNLYYFVKS